jgi:hypothetical protein
MDDRAVETLRRWEQAGGHWRVVSRGPYGVAVALLRCDGGEEADRIQSGDPDLLAYLGGRQTSEMTEDS